MYRIPHPSQLPSYLSCNPFQVVPCYLSHFSLWHKNLCSLSDFTFSSFSYFILSYTLFHLHLTINTTNLNHVHKGNDSTNLGRWEYLFRTVFIFLAIFFSMIGVTMHNLFYCYYCIWLKLVTIFYGIETVLRSLYIYMSIRIVVQCYLNFDWLVSSIRY